MPAVIYETGSKRFERRIGRRLTIQPLEIMWVLPPREDRPSVEAEPAGLMLDVSITGAAVSGPNDLALAPDSVVGLRFEGYESKVTVRRAAPSGKPDCIRYGVEFMSLERLLRKRIYEIVGNGRPEDYEWNDNT